MVENKIDIKADSPICTIIDIKLPYQDRSFKKKLLFAFSYSIVSFYALRASLELVAVFVY